MNISPTPTFGVLYALYGLESRPELLWQLSISIATIRHHNPRLRVAVATDNPQAISRIADVEQVFPLECFPDTDKLYSPRLRAFYNPPYDFTLALDADVICIAPFDLSWLSEFDLAFTPVHSRGFNRRTERLEGENSSTAGVVPESFPDVQGGVIGFHRRAAWFWKDVLSIYELSQRAPDRSPLQENDQCAIKRAWWDRRKKLSAVCLSADFNAPPRRIGPETKLVHFAVGQMATRLQAASRRHNFWLPPPDFE